MLPSRLSETGLYAELATDALAPGVMPYAPRFELWSDGATKRRWLWLPPGTRIDTREMDDWRFPEGTRIWKEFTREGKRVETRLLQKTGPQEDDWVGVAYLWADDQREAHAAPYGAIDVQGTPHNAPAASECMACHGGVKSRVLGVSAIQLGYSSASSLDLKRLSDSDLLTHPPAQPEFPLPGSATEQAALGYLHANCAHCHNQNRPGADGRRCYDPENELDMHLSVADLSHAESTATYRTTQKVVKPGHPGKSRLFELVSHRGIFQQMPPLASERVDQHGVDTLRSWIESR